MYMEKTYSFMTTLTTFTYYENKLNIFKQNTELNNILYDSDNTFRQIRRPIMTSTPILIL